MCNFTRTSSVVEELLSFGHLKINMSIQSHTLVNNGWSFVKIIVIIISCNGMVMQRIKVCHNGSHCSLIA